MARSVVALDIGESLVKMVWYAGKTRKKAVSVPLLDNLVANGEILSMDAMADFLRQTAKENGIPRTSAALILPASLVFTRTVTVPAMTDAQLTYNLPYEFKDYLAQEKNQYYYDYAVQDRQENEETGEVTELQLFACATLRQTIAAYREMCRRAGFRLRCAIPEEAAYAGILAANPPDTEDICFADIGYNAIRLQIFRNGSFITRRTAELGLRDVVQALADTRGIDVHMAHEHLRSDYENALTDPACAQIYHRMAVEIMKAVNFYNYNNRQQTLHDIYLCGGGAAIEPLRGAISELTDLALHPAHELLPAGGCALEQPWLYAKAIGCALQS